MDGVDDHYCVTLPGSRRWLAGKGRGAAEVDEVAGDGNPRKVRIPGATGTEVAVADVRKDQLPRLGHAVSHERCQGFFAADGELRAFRRQELDVGRRKRRGADGLEAVGLATVAFGKADERDEA